MQHLVTMVTENKKAFTDKQFAQAKLAWSIHHIMGAPSIAHLGKLLQTNAIRKNPLIIEDIKLALAIFRDDIGTLKGKSTRKQTLTQRTDYINLPAEIYTKYGNIELCMDTMQINNMYFLTLIDTMIQYQKVVGINKKNKEGYY